MILAVVDRQLVFDAVEFEAAFGDPVSIATDNRAKVRMTLQVSVEIVEAEHCVVKPTVAIRDFERSHDAAIVHNLSFDTVAISQRVNVNALSVRGFSKTFLFHSGLTFRVEAKPEGHDGQQQQNQESASQCHNLSLLSFASISTAQKHWRPVTSLR